MTSILGVVSRGDLLRIIRVDGGDVPIGDQPIEKGDDLYLSYREAKVIARMLTKAVDAWAG